MVATSQPQATEAGLRALADGGTAADACVAAAAMLCVVEPMSTGIGGDAFAITCDGGELTGLNASGRSPRSGRHERAARRAAVRPEVRHCARSGVGLDRVARAPRAPRARSLPARCRRRRRGRIRGDARDRGHVGARGRGDLRRRRAARHLPAGAFCRGQARAARVRAHAAADRRGGAERVLHRRGRAGDRRLLVARGGRPRGACARMGRAPAAAAGQRARVRAAPERTGRSRPAGDRDRGRARPRARRDDRSRPPRRRGHEARVRRCLPAHRRRPVAGRLPRPRLPRGPARARRSRAGRFSRRRCAAARGHRVPVRRRRRAPGVLVHPERVHRVGIGRGRPWPRVRTPEPRSGFCLRGWAPEPDRPRPPPVPHDHPGHAAARRRVAATGRSG